jgi:quinoprotein glucose dehydrogenase
MPGFPSFSQQSVDSIIKYVTSGEDSPTTPEAVASDMAYRFTGHRKWLDPQGYPATKPPWGTLNALDLNTGEYLWQIPLGEYPELVSQGITDTGSDNYGGPIVTAGGIVFIGASSHDKKFHAFDKTTGKLLWEAKLPFSGVATPATYQVNGLQFVVIAAGGGRQRGDSGGMYVAFALPARKSP